MPPSHDNPDPGADGAGERQSVVKSHKSTNFFDSVVECIKTLEDLETNEDSSKQDVVDSMRMRLSAMISRVVTNNHCTSMAMEGWAVAG